MRTIEIEEADYDRLTERARAVGLEPDRLVSALLQLGADGSGLIVKTPGTNGGRARLVGTRIAVWTMEGLRRRHSDADDPVGEILEVYPHLTRAGIEAALSYARAHVGEIEDDLTANGWA